MKQLLKALDAGFTAFCNELWLPTFGFHLFDDPADALEDDVRPCHMCDETCGVCRDAVLDERAKRVVDVPVELAGSLSAPGDTPGGGATPEAASSGYPKESCNIRFAPDLPVDKVRGEEAQLTADERDYASFACRYFARHDCTTTEDKALYFHIADKLDPN